MVHTFSPPDGGSLRIGAATRSGALAARRIRRRRLFAAGPFAGDLVAGAFAIIVAALVVDVAVPDGRIGLADRLRMEMPLTLLMLIGSLAFIGYAVVFLFRNFAGGGFELGVRTLNGVTRENLNALNPAIMHYIGHLHVATAGFIAATGIAVAALSWYGVRRGEWWAWIAAVVSPVVGLAVALPYHYTGTFEHDWVTHLGPIYVATLVFVVGALLALRAMTRRT